MGLKVCLLNVFGAAANPCLLLSPVIQRIYVEKESKKKKADLSKFGQKIRDSVFMETSSSILIFHAIDLFLPAPLLFSSCFSFLVTLV